MKNGDDSLSDHVRNWSWNIGEQEVTSFSRCPQVLTGWKPRRYVEICSLLSTCFLEPPAGGSV